MDTIGAPALKVCGTRLIVSPSQYALSQLLINQGAYDATRRYVIMRIRRYTCPSELAPVLEAALAANGYTIEIPYQENTKGDAALVMTQGAVSVLLTQEAASDQCEVDIWGEAQHAAAVLLESLPLDLEKLPTLQGMS